MRSIRQTSMVAAALAFALALASCDKQEGCGQNPAGPTCPPVPPSTTPAVRTVIMAGSGALPAKAADVEIFTTATSGTLDVTLDWTFPESPIGVYIVRGECSLDQFNARTCDFVTRSEIPQKPRKLALTGFAAGRYALMIANFSDVDESVSIEVGLTTGGSASSANADAAADRGRDPRFSGTIEVVVAH